MSNSSFISSTCFISSPCPWTISKPIPDTVRQMSVNSTSTDHCMLWLFCVYCRASLLKQISSVAAKKSRVARDFFSGPWWIKEHRSSYTQQSVPGMMMIPRCQWQPRFATNGEDWCGGTAMLSCHNHDNLRQKCWCFSPSLALFFHHLYYFPNDYLNFFVYKI